MVREITVEEDKWEITGKKEIKKYETSDGKIHEIKEQAIKHQHELDKKEKIKNIPYISCNQILSISDEYIQGWYYLHNEQEAELLEIKNIKDKYDIKLEFPNWFLLYKERDLRWDEYVMFAISKLELQNELQDFLNNMPEDIK